MYGRSCGRGIVLSLERGNLHPYCYVNYLIYKDLLRFFFLFPILYLHSDNYNAVKQIMCGLDSLFYLFSNPVQCQRILLAMQTWVVSFLHSVV